METLQELPQDKKLTALAQYPLGVSTWKLAQHLKLPHDQES
jgi:hypothetical protein